MASNQAMFCVCSADTYRNRSSGPPGANAPTSYTSDACPLETSLVPGIRGYKVLSPGRIIGCVILATVTNRSKSSADHSISAGAYAGSHQTLSHHNVVATEMYVLVGCLAALLPC
jgi:hypothetical protein